ncbi:adenylyltransferase/cytidyltransferase family protein [Candidatus Woesearchaeota archaeon]|nr:adenylyltransferase/cytidyltransferase family protein [Candidatus Woesearchaeota archaeon]
MKIKSPADMKLVVQDLKQKNKRIVSTNGAFDLLHAGHIRCLEFAKSKGDVLIVGLNSDSSIKKYKSETRPIIPENERAEMLSALEYVDYIVIFEEETPDEFIKLVCPDVHIKGAEYKENLSEKELVESLGGIIFFRERKPGEVTTTKIIEKIMKTYKGD